MCACVLVPPRTSLHKFMYVHPSPPHLGPHGCVSLKVLVLYGSYEISLRLDKWSHVFQGYHCFNFIWKWKFIRLVQWPAKVRLMSNYVWVQFKGVGECEEDNEHTSPRPHQILCGLDLRAKYRYKNDVLSHRDNLWHVTITLLEKFLNLSFVGLWLERDDHIESRFVGPNFSSKLNF